MINEQNMVIQAIPLLFTIPQRDGSGRILTNIFHKDNPQELYAFMICAIREQGEERIAIFKLLQDNAFALQLSNDGVSKAIISIKQYIAKSFGATSIEGIEIEVSTDVSLNMELEIEHHDENGNPYRDENGNVIKKKVSINQKLN